MLEDPDALVRQTAAFALGELGGATSARRLERQLALEEGALWRKRHPELIPILREILERLAPSVSRSLHGLLALLEKHPEELRAWAREPSVSVEHKTGALTLLEENLPDELLTVLPAFISAAQALVETAVGQKGTDSYYCDRLFTLVLLHRERLLPALSGEARAELRAVARRLVAALSLNCSLGAAVVLQHVGHREDALLLEAHRPTEPILAKVFDEATQALRQRPPN